MGQRGQLQPGDVVDGKYRIDRVLGEGGMGLVFEGTDTRLQRQVAIKVLLPEFVEDETWVARFLREARAAVRLSSEHAVRVHEVGELPDGTPYMVMEYLVGRDLAAVLEDAGKLALGDAVGYVLQATEAIADAHAAGIVHRDIKPANLFLTRRADRTPLIKVLDFGLAKTPALAGESSLTGDTTIFGSPQYMSPEQLRGSANVDGRTDIWALGATLYELLAGGPPFQATTVPELGAMIMRDPVVPPHVRCPEIPVGVSEIVVRCLEKEASRRFANVGDFASALAPWADQRNHDASARIKRILTTTASLPKPGDPRLPHVLALSETAPHPAASNRPRPGAGLPGTTATEAVLDTSPALPPWRRSWIGPAAVAAVALAAAFTLFARATGPKEDGGRSAVASAGAVSVAVVPSPLPSTSTAPARSAPPAPAPPASSPAPEQPVAASPVPSVGSAKPAALASPGPRQQLAGPARVPVQPRPPAGLPPARLPTVPDVAAPDPEPTAPPKPGQVY